MSIITVGIDLAKNIFAVHGINEQNKAELLKHQGDPRPVPALIAKPL